MSGTFEPGPALKSRWPGYLFISHATEDTVAANRIRDALESLGVKCWSAVRDINPGEVYTAVIPPAITASGGLILIVSEHANQSRNVQIEVQLAFEEDKKIYPVRADDAELPPALAYCVGAAQFEHLREKSPAEVAARLARLISGPIAAPQPKANPTGHRPPRRLSMLVATLAIATAIAAAWTWYAFPEPEPPPPLPLQSKVDPFVDLRTANDRKEAVRLQTHTGNLNDRLQSRDLFQRCADRGDRIAKMWIARNMFHGLSVYSKDPVGAAKLASEVFGFVKTVAESGSTEAQFLVGAAYQHGIGVEPDPKRAARYYASAGEGADGMELAMTNLADMYADGLGIERNAPAALELYERAIDRGLPRAMKRLGDHYRDGGDIVNKDSAKALMWYGKSAALEYAAGMYSLAMMYIEGDAPRNYSEAATLLAAAARDGEPIAWYQLGNLYYKGLLGPEDIKKATENWVTAARMGVKEAQDALRDIGVTDW